MSRRWLEAEGIWSCRVRLPENSMDGSGSSHTAAHSNGTNAMAQPSSPAMHIDDSGDALAAAVRNINHLKNDMVLDLPSEPDAQATVTDFLDFTEYLPSDLMRSLTLVQKLEKISTEASEEVESLTKTYGELPSLPAESRPSATNLRLQISQKLAESHKARSLAYAEACRLAESIERHKNREKNIVARLNHMVETYPATREPTPEASNATQATRPKITLRLDGSRTDRSKVHRRRAPRITVPGEVLAPYDFDYDSFDSGSDTEGMVGANQTPARLKLKVAKKEKIPKPPRGPRPPGAMGTNVHSSVAGISTSNALAKLKPPPADAQPGSEDAPWLKLTAWELATLRKEMKKNAVWSPSDTMIARELAKKNRGIEAYRKWRASNGGEAEGTTNNAAQDGTSNTVLAEGEISADAFGKADVQLSNRGMKLNEAKKLKRENQAKELAKIAAEEAEASARKLEAAALSIKDLFSKPKPAEVPVVKTPVKTPARKRKREQTAETDKTEKTEKTEKTDKTEKAEKAEKTEKVEVEKVNELAKTPVPNPPKKTKTETPINPPSTQSSFATAAANQTLGSAAASTRGDIPLSGTNSPVPTPVPVIQERKASTPILPPVKEKKTIKKEAPAKKEPTPVPLIKKLTPTPTPTQTPAPELQPPRASSRGKASSLEPPMTARDRPRRASTVHNTPAPDSTSAAQPTRTTSRRKKPVPGAVTNTNDGTAPVTVGKRTAATRKSRPKKQKGEVVEWDEFDDEGNIIDPDEPRYCICNRVSYGTMIGCENPECEKEWFHLECVGLTSSPARTTKWYCPECRVKLGIGEKGEVNARGQKK